jgi:hypothetical protein
MKAFESSAAIRKWLTMLLAMFLAAEGQAVQVQCLFPK